MHKAPKLKIFHGNFLHTPHFGELDLIEDCSIVVKDGIIIGIYEDMPAAFTGVPIEEIEGFGIPGFCDMHTHAAQYPLRGIGYDLPQTERASDYVYPAEIRMDDAEYAKKVYEDFASHMVRVGSLHSAVYSTIHTAGTEALMRAMNEAGLRAYVGKVNMDQNCPDELREDTQRSVEATIPFLEKKYEGIAPIITPRYASSCTGDLLHALGYLADEMGTPVQSHLGVDPLVGKFYSVADTAARLFDSYGLFGETPTLMAQCVHMLDQEIDLMAKRGVYAVHCPSSNLNLNSGTCPVRRLLMHGVPVCLGTDMAGGDHIDMMSTIVDAIRVSAGAALLGMGNPLSLAEAFYLATTAGGAFFGETGIFAMGYSFDALIIDDKDLGSADQPLPERFSRFIYTGDERQIKARYMGGALL